MIRTERVSIGLAGAGYIANYAHLPILSTRSDVSLEAICDIDPSKAKAAADRFQIPSVYSTVDDMLSNEELQLVDICLPPENHSAAITQVLEHGVNTLVEKPMTLSTVDADAAIALAERKGLKLYVVHNYSALPAVLRAKNVVRRGSIGCVRGVHINHLNVFTQRHLDTAHWCHSLPGDYFAEVGPHLCMLLVEFLGPVQEARSIAIKTSNYDSVRLDEYGIVARTKDAIGTISCSMNCPSRVLTIDIWGTEGSVHVDADYQAVVRHWPIDSQLNVWARGKAAVRDIVSRTLALGLTTINVLAQRYPAETIGHQYLIAQCIADLKGESVYPIDTKLARDAVRLIELAFG